MKSPLDIDVNADELNGVRSLTDFDLTMFLSKIHDFGWPQARNILSILVRSSEKERKGKK